MRLNSHVPTDPYEQLLGRIGRGIVLIWKESRRRPHDDSFTKASQAQLLLQRLKSVFHQLDGKEVADKEGRVAFGSKKWEIFRGLDKLRKGNPVDVYIYASHGGGDREFATSWHARYIGYVDSQMGAHPAGMRYRPPSNGQSASDNSGYWAVFWEVENLQQLPEEKRISLADLTGYGKKKAYGHAFPPEGPIIIEHP
jgi:hypothetical protein